MGGILARKPDKFSVLGAHVAYALNTQRALVPLLALNIVKTMYSAAARSVDPVRPRAASLYSSSKTSWDLEQRWLGLARIVDGLRAPKL